MKIRLLEIKVYYRDEKGYNFFEEKSYDGKVILREDLKFEGVLVDNINHEDHLVTGTLMEGNGAYLMVLAKNASNWPYIFQGISTGKEVFGKWNIQKPFSRYNAGKCKIVFEGDAPDSEVVSDLCQRRDEIKSLMSSFNSDIYDGFIKYMDFLVSEFMKGEAIEIEKELGKPLKKLDA